MVDQRRKVVRTEKAPKPVGAYSQAIVAGDFVFVAGQGGKDPKTGEMLQGIGAQTRQALTNIKSILQAAGTSLENATKVTVFIADIKEFSKMNEVYLSFFKKDPPARATVQVVLPESWLVEIEAIALLPRRKR
ncbi:MAG: Rid family detoxifying hydrolase [Thaumarchaeota archaeon]|nr:deaminase [Nitrososphaerota archaeon]MBI3022773.1 deaminase [Nitrososphaerota archaeon]MBI3116118.1 deaminase [Nitrososphaerota archaeon]MCS4540334.1 Rid family detoxifying hydrolase [Nitrososphaerota archaeon]